MTARDELLTNAALCIEQAELINEVARSEPNPIRARIMRAISEHYYLLHDDLIALEQLAGPSLTRLCREARAG